MRLIHFRSGYAFLVSVLVIGAIASVTTVSLLLLGMAAERSGESLVRSSQALEHAKTCAERALRALRTDNTYAGNETVTLTNGSCVVKAVQGSGNASRTLCTEGSSGKSIRRLEIQILQIQPTTRVTSYREVSSFPLCP